MTQGEVLGHDCRPGTKEVDERPEEETNQANHGGRIPTEKKSEEMVSTRDGPPAIPIAPLHDESSDTTRTQDG